MRSRGPSRIPSSSRCRSNGEYLPNPQGSWLLGGLVEGFGGSPIYNEVMIETLYNTQSPEKNRSECYVLVLTSRVASGGQAYAFMEEHGQWNADLQRFVYRVNSIHAEEPLSYQNARVIYETTKRNLALRGFVHSVGSDGQHKEPRPDQMAQAESAMA